MEYLEIAKILLEIAGIVLAVIGGAAVTAPKVERFSPNPVTKRARALLHVIAQNRGHALTK